MSKKDNFKNEINYIKDSNLKTSCEMILELLPDYFYEISASSGGNNHPSYAAGDKGLIRHTKAALCIAKVMFDNPLYKDKYTEHERDLIYISIMIHDGLKRGLNENAHTTFDHPLLIGKFVEDNNDKINLTSNDIEFIKKVTASHMGPWNTNNYSTTILPVPKTKYESFVHMCDYLASRKCILFTFDDNNNITNV